MNPSRDQQWNGRALNELLSVVHRNAARLARRLEAQHLLHDPRHILCALAARRLLPLDVPVMRPLARPAESESLDALAFHTLQTPDRSVLWPGGWSMDGAHARDPDRPQDRRAREHLASALLRLTWNAQAARRSTETDAPPDGQLG